MKRRFRLTKSTDFQRVRRYGRSFAHPLLVLVVLSNAVDKLRIGVVAGRFTGNAVRRNRVKRQIRAALLPFRDSIPLGWDAIFIARRPITDASFEEIRDAVQTLLLRAGIIKKDVV